MELTVVGTYRRRLGASLDRLLENTLDWAHLPFVHASSFKSIDCSDAGPWGWRATVGSVSADAEASLEVLVDVDDATWVSRTLGGAGEGSEVWSRANSTGPRSCEVTVEFHAPDVRPGSAARLGAAYERLYRRLYDEDESMMMGRQAGLDDRGIAPIRVVEVDRERCAFEARCPHQLGPLDDAPVVDGIITCPWHGYRFDVRTGRHVDGGRLRLTHVPVP